MTRRRSRTTRRSPLAEAMYEAGDGRRVADACNVSQSLVSQWKCGSRKVPVRYRKTIARVLKVSMKSLWPPEGKA